MKSSNDPEVVPYQVDDQIKELQALMDLFLESTAQAYKHRSIDPSAVHSTSYIQKILLDSKTRFMVCKVKSKIAGFVMAHVQDEHQENETLVPTCVWLHSLFVRPEHRKQGLAERMIHAIEDWCRSQKIGYLKVNLLSGNSAQPLYEKLSFKPESVIMEKQL